jgi:NAD(P)-dependent dehydrogenase (short-subunit alcohol dehydrogenase family)
MKKLQGKTALVTGSSRGVGKLVAEALAKEGCRVFVHGRTLEAAEATLALVRAAGSDGKAFAAEMHNPADLDRLAAEVLAAGGVDILYNNAAVMSVWNEDISKQDLSDWARVFQINIFAPMRLTTLLLPSIQAKGWGRIVNVTSGIDKTWQLAAYGSSKWALDKWTDDLGALLKGTKIIVSRMDPGWLRTDLGGPNADNAPETVLPGAMVPVMLSDDAAQAQFFSAQLLRDAKI